MGMRRLAFHSVIERRVARAFAVALVVPVSSSLAQVLVSLDMDVARAGRQHARTVLPGDGSFVGSVTIADPTRSSVFFSIGYLGGLDRGIAFGHVLDNQNVGVISHLTPIAGTPANPANTAYVFPAFPGANAFSGPEIQYVEWGPGQPAVIEADPPPIFDVVIHYAAARPCDTFAFHLADFVTIWRGGPGGGPPAGAFSTGASVTLDTGGDAVPDGTRTVAGVDADAPVPVPPAAFTVDYVDGPAGGGPATLRITWPGDLDGDRDVDLNDLATLLANFGRSDGVAYEDGDISGDGSVSLGDLAALLAAFGMRCENG